MNNVTMLGRLARDPETKEYNGGSFTKFVLATNKDFKKEGEKDADFHNCVAFGNTGKVISDYLHQGDQICIKGRVENNNYEKDGVKHYGYQIVVERMDFCGSKKDSNNEPTAPDSENIAKRDSSFVAVPEGAEEELPFDKKP